MFGHHHFCIHLYPDVLWQSSYTWKKEAWYQYKKNADVLKFPRAIYYLWIVGPEGSLIIISEFILILYSFAFFVFFICFIIILLFIYENFFFNSRLYYELPRLLSCWEDFNKILLEDVSNNSQGDGTWLLFFIWYVGQLREGAHMFMYEKGEEVQRLTRELVPEICRRLSITPLWRDWSFLWMLIMNF